MRIKARTKIKAGGYESLASGATNDAAVTLNLSKEDLQRGFNSFGKNGKAHDEKLNNVGFKERLKGMFGHSR